MFSHSSSGLLLARLTLCRFCVEGSDKQIKLEQSRDSDALGVEREVRCALDDATIHDYETLLAGVEFTQRIWVAWARAKMINFHPSSAEDHF